MRVGGCSNDIVVLYCFFECESVDERMTKPIYPTTTSKSFFFLPSTPPCSCASRASAGPIERGESLDGEPKQLKLTLLYLGHPMRDSLADLSTSGRGSPLQAARRQAAT